jgi:hypothetical protein
MKIFFILIYIALISACTDSKPKEVLNKHQMASMLIEMYIRESQINELGVRPDSANILHQLMLNKVLEKKNISEDVYIKSYDYYIANLKKFDEVYAIVIDSLKLRETLAQQRFLPPPVEPDQLGMADFLDTLDAMTIDPLSPYIIGPRLPVFDSMLYIFPFDSIPPFGFDTIPPVEPNN